MLDDGECGDLGTGCGLRFVEPVRLLQETPYVFPFRWDDAMALIGGFFFHEYDGSRFVGPAFVWVFFEEIV